MSEIDADLEGPVSPPRDNGEIVFAAPWEQRVFGLAVALCRSQACDWESLRQRLIRHITDDPDQPYWRNWTQALEDVLAETSMVTPSELDVRHRELRDRPAGHDHHLTPSRRKIPFLHGVSGDSASARGRWPRGY